MATKCKGYRYSVRWIALNDEPEETSEHILSQLVSVVLIADLFGVQPEKVARDVRWARNRIAKEESK